MTLTPQEFVGNKWKRDSADGACSSHYANSRSNFT
jgi:hypothetical protein